MQGAPAGGVGPGLSSLLVCSFFLAAALGQMNFTGHQALRVLAKNEKQLSLLRDLEGLKPQKAGTPQGLGTCRSPSLTGARPFGSLLLPPPQICPPEVSAKDENSAEKADVARLQERLGTLVWKVDFWHGPARPSLPVDMRVPFSELKDVKAYPESHGLPYSIMIKDIQVLLDEEREAMAKSRWLERSTSSFSYSSYHTLEEIYRWMDSFVTEHSDVVSKNQIGHSFENRSILVLKFSTGGSQRPAVWIGSGIHSRESITHATGIWTAKKIVSEYGKDPILTNILNALDIFMEVVTNPDGFAFTHSMNRLWRKNKSTRPGIFCMGVDLNRNWKSGFGEPEVAAIVDFITSHGNIKALISIHSYAQMPRCPYGHLLAPVPNQEELLVRLQGVEVLASHPLDVTLQYKLAEDAVQALRKVHGLEYPYSSISSTLYLASGIAVDWACESGIKYAFTFELRDPGRYGFLLPASQIIATAQGTWLALRTTMEHTGTHPY